MLFRLSGLVMLTLKLHRPQHWAFNSGFSQHHLLQGYLARRASLCILFRDRKWFHPLQWGIQGTLYTWCINYVWKLQFLTQRCLYGSVKSVILKLWSCSEVATAHLPRSPTCLSDSEEGTETVAVFRNPGHHCNLAIFLTLTVLLAGSLG